MCRRCGGEEETIAHLMRCKKNRNTAGRLLRALGKFGGNQPIIMASLSEELVKGNGRVKWKGWLNKLERVAEGQEGRSRNQMEVIVRFMKNLKEEEEDEE